MADEPGWVVRMMANRDRLATGDYGFFEWRDYCDAHGISVLTLPMPAGRRAFLLADTILLCEGMGRFERAWYAWEEIGHHATSVGNREFWRTRPQGEMTLRKIERRARDYRVVRPSPDSFFSGD